ncbi:MAG: hypothetical protein ACRDTR_12030, partial [Rubrobacter sp.]
MTELAEGRVQDPLGGNTLQGDVSVGTTLRTACSSVPGAVGVVMLETPGWLVVLFLGPALAALVVLILYL